jgi:hypothetical protein
MSSHKWYITSQICILMLQLSKISTKFFWLLALRLIEARNIVANWFNYNVNKTQPNHTHQRQLVAVCSIWWICYITTCNNAHVHVQCSREFSLVSIERYDFYIHLHSVEISPWFPYNFYIQWNLCNPIPEFSNILRHLTTNYDPKVVLLIKIKLSIPTSCAIRHISLVPWCVGLDSFWHPVQSGTFPWSLDVLD